VRGRLRSLLRLPRAAPRVTARLVCTTRRDGYSVQRWELDLEPGWCVPFLALVPDTAAAETPAPAVLCFPGTDYSKELLAGEPERPGGLARYHKYPANPDSERMGWHYVRAGFVAVCVDNPATQEAWDARWPGRTELSQWLIAMGRSYFSLAAQQGLALFRWVRGLRCVDRLRVATSGFSLGTNPALMVAVLEPRVAAVVHNGHLGSQRDRAVSLGLAPEKMWQIVPGMLEWLDRPDLAAALAPRPLLICEGAAPWHARRVRNAYETARAAGRLRIIYNPAYATAARRRRAQRLSGAPEGVTEETFKQCVCQDSPNHGFKPEFAVPWLRTALGP
jgi:dienelactone hydrolase